MSASLLKPHREPALEKGMHKNKPARDVTRRLEQAVDRVGKDAQKSKILAAALCGFAQPVPDYELLRQHLLRPCERDGSQDTSRNRRFGRTFSATLEGSGQSAGEVLRKP